MKTLPRKAFTLTEIVIGMGIMVFLTGALVAFLQSSSRESAFSSEFFTGVLLSQKVMEDLTEEMNSNPHGFQALGIDEIDSPPTNVTYGQSTFFTFLEDRHPPFGQIDGQGEGSIDPNFGPLYGQVKDFTVTSNARRVSLSSSIPENSHLAIGDVRFHWMAKSKSTHYQTSALFFAPEGPKPVKLALQLDPVAVEKEICARFFRTPGGNLSQLISQYGGNRETITALGTIYYVTQTFLQSPGFQSQLQEYRNKLQTIQSISPSDQTDIAYDMRKALAKTAFGIGQSCFQVTLLLASQAELLPSPLDQQKLGQVLSTYPKRFSWGLESLNRLYATYVAAIVQSRATYRSLLTYPQAIARGPREYTQTLNRLLDLYQILAITPEETSGLANYKTFLDEVTSFSQARNPFLNRLALQEQTFAINSATLLEKHPALARVSGITRGVIPRFQAAVRPLLQAAVNNTSLSGTVPVAVSSGASGSSGPTTPVVIGSPNNPPPQPPPNANTGGASAPAPVLSPAAGNADAGGASAPPMSQAPE